MRVVRKLMTLLAIFALAAAAGCGGDDDDSPETVNQTPTVTESAPKPATPPEPTQPGPPPPEPANTCTADGGKKIEIVRGDFACAVALATVAGYDTQGPSVQEVGEWKCEGGDAATRPILFTCVSRIGEFTVREAGG
jgi:hypothetical protein